jgi:hypothetical protein
MSACFLSVVITMREQVDPSVVAQCIIVKWVTNKNVKPAHILYRLRAHFGDETLSRTQVYDYSESLKEGQTQVENIPDATLLRTSANQENAEQICSLIQDNHHIMVYELAKIVAKCVSTVETIVNDELHIYKSLVYISTSPVHGPKMMYCNRLFKNMQLLFS